MNVFINYGNEDKKFDPLDNEYYQIKVYVSTNPDTQKAEEIIDGSVKLVRCPNEEVKKYFRENARWFYNKVVCFDNA